MAMACWTTGSAQKAGTGPASTAASLPVTTATTPGSAFARLVSMRLIRAWAYGLRRTAAWSIPDSWTSSI